MDLILPLPQHSFLHPWHHTSGFPYHSLIRGRDITCYFPNNQLQVQQFNRDVWSAISYRRCTRHRVIRVKSADVLLCHVVHQIQQDHALITATYLLQHELQNFLSQIHTARNRTVRSIICALCHQSHTSITFALGYRDH